MKFDPPVYVIRVGERYRYGFGRGTTGSQRIAQRFDSPDAAWEHLLHLHPQHRRHCRVVRLVRRPCCCRRSSR